VLAALARREGLLLDEGEDETTQRKGLQFALGELRAAKEMKVIVKKQMMANNTNAMPGQIVHIATRAMWFASVKPGNWTYTVDPFPLSSLNHCAM
jgi:hypothetical protein